MIGIKLNEKKIGELAKQPRIVLSPEDMVSKAAGRMSEGNIHSIPVLDEKRFAGMITAHAIVSVDAPPKTKIGTLLIQTQVLEADETLARACSIMSKNNLDTTPIGRDKSLSGVVNFWDIIDWCLEQEELKNVKVSEIIPASIPLIDRHGNLGKARIGLRKTGGRLLVREDGSDYIVEIEDYIDRISKNPLEGTTLGERVGEKMKTTDIEVASLMKRIKVRVKEDDTVHTLLSEMKKYHAPFTVLGGSVIGRNEILGYLGHFRMREDLTRIAVIRKDTEFDDNTWRQMNASLGNFLVHYVKKHTKESILEFKIDIKEYHKTGQRSEYVMKARFLTDREEHHAEKSGWDPIEVFDKLMAALKKQFKY